MQKKYEAKYFLSKGKCMMNFNRFKNKESVLELVNELYKAGSKIVYVAGIYQYVSDDEMYADRMLVELPEEPEKRLQIFQVCNKEIEDEGFEVMQDTGQETVELCWD